MKSRQRVKRMTMSHHHHSLVTVALKKKNNKSMKRNLNLIKDYLAVFDLYVFSCQVQLRIMVFYIRIHIIHIN